MASLLRARGAVPPAQDQNISHDDTLAGGAGGHAGTASGVYRSADGGGSWAPASSGLTNQFITALAIDPSNPAVLYAGTDGGLFKTTSGGSSWTELKRNTEERRASSGN